MRYGVQIKIFTGMSYEAVQEDVNDWLAHEDQGNCAIHDIKLTQGEDCGLTVFTVLVYFERNRLHV